MTSIEELARQLACAHGLDPDAMSATKMGHLEPAKIFTVDSDTKIAPVWTFYLEEAKALREKSDQLRAEVPTWPA